MYNRYIPGSFPDPDHPICPAGAGHEDGPPAAPIKPSSGLSGLLKGLDLEKLDAGDILLLLILLFLFLEGDDVELLLTLGLLLLLGLH